MYIVARVGGIAAGREAEEGDAEDHREDTNAGNVAGDARAAELGVGVGRLEGGVGMTVVEKAQAAAVGSRGPAPGRAGAGVAYGKVEDGIDMMVGCNGAVVLEDRGREVVIGMAVAVRDALGAAGSVRTSIAPAAATAMMLRMDARAGRGVLPGERDHCYCRNVPLGGLSIEWDP